MTPRAGAFKLLRFLLLCLVVIGFVSVQEAQAATKLFYSQSYSPFEMRMTEIPETGPASLGTAFYTSAAGSPQAVAADLERGNLYFSDPVEGKIFKTGLDGSNVSEYLSGVFAEGIAVDGAHNYLYYAQSHTGGGEDYYNVIRVNLSDGSNPVVLYNTPAGTPAAIAVDAGSGDVYFSDNHETVAKIFKVHQGTTSPVEFLTGVHAKGLSVHNGYLYYTEAYAPDFALKGVGLTDKSVTELYNSPTGVPFAVTVDPFANKLYFSDSHSTVAKIFRSELDGSNRVSLIDGSVNSQGLLAYTNTDPTISTNNGVTVKEDSEIVINSSYLEATDLEQAPSSLIYTLEVSPTLGQLKLNGTVLNVGDTFSQDDLNNNRITYLPESDQNGTDSFTFSLIDGLDGSIDFTAFAIVIEAINDAPTFTKGADQSVPADAGAQTIANWATDITAGPADESGQTYQFNVTNNNTALFAVQPQIAADGILTFTPAIDTYGSALVTVQLRDNGGTANGGADSVTETFTITVDRVFSQLAKPAKPVVSEGIVGWVAVNHENNGYSLQLYKNGAAEGAPIKIAHGADLSYDLSGIITTPGSYTVTVTANGTGVYTDSEESEQSDPWIVTTKSSAAQITGFSLPEQTGPAVIGDGAIELEVAHGTDLTNLIASFTTSANIQSVKVGGINQLSGATANDFSSAVTYTITAEDGTVKDWVVTVRAGLAITMAALPSEVTESNIFAQIFRLSVHNDTVADAVYSKDISLNGDFSALTVGKVTRENMTTVAAAVYGNLSYNTGMGIITLDESVLNKSRSPISTKITVASKTKPQIMVNSITVTAAANTVAEGTALQMSAEVLPENAADKTFTWSVIPGTGSANITPAGILTGLSAGTVTVKATANDGSGVAGGLEIRVTKTASQPDTIAPTVTDSTIGTSDQTTGSVTLSWIKALDNRTPQQNLEYLVYKSNSGNIATLANIEANGTPAGSYTVNVNTKEITGLTAGNTYYFNIIVKDEAGNKTVYKMVKIVLAADSGGGSSSDDDGNDTSDQNTPEENQYDQIIKKALRQNTDAAVSLAAAKDTQAQITPELVRDLGAKNKYLQVANEGVAIEFPPQALVTNELTRAIENEGTMLELGSQAIDAGEKQEMLANAQLGASIGLFDIGGKIFDLTARIVDKNGKITRITSFNEPVAVTIDLSDLEFTVEEIAKLTAVRYEKDAQGNIIPVKLGGSYDPGTKTFIFYTDRFSLYGIVKSEKLTTISLTIGSLQSLVNGQQITGDITPTIIDNRTMVPLRFIGESLGAQVEWLEASRTVNIELEETKLQLIIGGTGPGLDVPAQIIRERTMVPLRYVSEMLGANVMWFPTAQKVEIVK